MNRCIATFALSLTLTALLVAGAAAQNEQVDRTGTPDGIFQGQLAVDIAQAATPNGQIAIAVTAQPNGTVSLSVTVPSQSPFDNQRLAAALASASSGFDAFVGVESNPSAGATLSYTLTFNGKVARKDLIEAVAVALAQLFGLEP